MARRKKVKEEEPVVEPQNMPPVKATQEIHPRPEGKPSTKLKNMWCPYCGVWTDSNYNKWGYRVLKCCGISFADFYIKKHNPQIAR
jgi:hypothetical protein